MNKSIQNSLSKAPGNTPNIVTALTGQFKDIAELMLGNQNKIKQGFNKEWTKNPAPLYISIDRKNAGFPVAAVI